MSFYCITFCDGVDVVWELAWLGRLSKTVRIDGKAAGKDS